MGCWRSLPSSSLCNGYIFGKFSIFNKIETFSKWKTEINYKKNHWKINKISIFCSKIKKCYPGLSIKSKTSLSIFSATISGSASIAKSVLRIYLRKSRKKNIFGFIENFENKNIFLYFQHSKFRFIKTKHLIKFSQ